jgi:hypothetical protein
MGAHLALKDSDDFDSISTQILQILPIPLHSLYENINTSCVIVLPLTLTVSRKMTSRPKAARTQGMGTHSAPAAIVFAVNSISASQPFELEVVRLIHRDGSRIGRAGVGEKPPEVMARGTP